jgi:uncharacterized protein
VSFLIDAGPLISFFARREEKYQHWAREILPALPQPLLTCDAVLAEASHLLGSPVPLLQAAADGLFVSRFDLERHLTRVLYLARKYADQPMDFADACLVVMSELHPQARIVTVDAEDFAVYRRFRNQPVPTLTPPRG